MGDERDCGDGLEQQCCVVFPKRFRGDLTYLIPKDLCLDHSCIMLLALCNSYMYGEDKMPQKTEF